VKPRIVHEFHGAGKAGKIFKGRKTVVAVKKVKHFFMALIPLEHFSK
jgi:hypothetical protein